MTPAQRVLIQEAFDLVHQLPSGIDSDGVDEEDARPDDMAFHIGSMIAVRLRKVLEELP